jgi:hypothetical protein
MPTAQQTAISILYCRSRCFAQGLKAHLRTLALQEGWDPQRLPTAQQLRDVDKSDLLRVRLLSLITAQATCQTDR